jgi:3D (Asp-Asp-Asp) domain-containing protein
MTWRSALAHTILVVALLLTSVPASSMAADRSGTNPCPGSWWITHYHCCELTYSGTVPRWGDAAADLGVLPLESLVYIGHYDQRFVVRDTGRGTGNWLDVYGGGYTDCTWDVEVIRYGPGSE